jgi:hypothetical protein
MSKNLETINTIDLSTVHGGAEPPAHYNGQDWANGAQGAAQGAARGGPMGAVVGFGAGFMKRNVGELFKATGDYFRERRRGQQLDAQLKARQGK